MGDYYDGTKLLSLKDIDGHDPEIYMCTSNRTAGKTTFFSRWFVRRFLNNKEKFMLLYRFNYELEDVANQFFKDIKGLWFDGHEMESKARARGIYHDLYLDGESCGYACALNNADSIKKRSHLFSDVRRMLFDEFQSETNHYCNDEIRKFQSVHTSVARGQGEQVRHVPVYMLGNTVSIINPYYTQMGVTTRIRHDTKFLRGKGYVLEQGYNKGASEAQLSSGFARAFSQSGYTAYSAQAVYLNDSTAFIDKPSGRPRYIATLKFRSHDYSILEYAHEGIMYVSRKADSNFPYRITVTTDDHNINYVMLMKNDVLFTSMRTLFNRGAFRFQDMQCKDALMCALSY